MILDANVWLGNWPFDSLEPDTAHELVAHQAALGINLSCVSSLSAITYRDPKAANERLFRETRSHVTFEPVPICNPSMANWRDETEEYVEQHHIRQARLVPNYHLYELDDERVDRFLNVARGLGLRISIQVRLEDERAHHPLMKVPGVPVESLAALAQRRPDETFLVLCAYRNEVLALADHENLLFGISHVEYLDTINSMLARIPATRLVFASHTPLFVTRAAMAKVEQCTAGIEAKQAIAGGNLAAWLGGERDQVPWLETKPS